MSEPALLDYLLNNGPLPDESELTAFNEVDLPDGLAVKTLNLVDLERTRAQAVPQQRTWGRGLSVGLALAASLLLVFAMPEETSTPQGNLENMTAKGLEESAPKVHLKLARMENGAAVRHRTDRAYSAGESLLFRVQSDSSGWVTLLNVQGSQISAILQSPIQGGDNDLLLPTGEIAQWSFDNTDRSGFFAVVSTITEVSSDGLVQQLKDSTAGEAVQAEALCLTARALGWQCDAIEVMVTE